MVIQLIISAEYRVKSWIKDGVYHRDYDPAVIYQDGSKFFYLNGEEIDSIIPDNDDENYL
jgi:hypothetical protein